MRIRATTQLLLLTSVLFMMAIAERQCDTFDVIETCPHSFGTVIQTIPDVDAFPDCTRLCKTQDVCYSAVYKKKTSTCQLNVGKSTLNVTGCSPAEMVTITTRRVPPSVPYIPTTASTATSTSGPCLTDADCRGNRRCTDGVCERDRRNRGRRN